MPNGSHHRTFAPLSLLALLLTACGGGGGGGDGPDPCLPSNTPGKPDLLQAPAFASGSTAAAGGTVTVTIPVDAETLFLTVTLMSSDRASYAGGVNHTVASPGEQTLSIDITTSPGTAAGDYFPLINLCSDFSACGGAGTGVAIAYSNDQQTPPGPNYVRTRYYDNGAIAGDFTTTCMPVPHVTVN